MIKKKLTRPDYVVILANLVPVYGVLFLNWSAREVFLVYCLETIIIGFFTLLKLGIAGAFKKRDILQAGGVNKLTPAWVFMLFFIVHYGMFVVIQMGMFFAVSGMGKNEDIGFFDFIFKWPQLLTNDALIMLGVFIVSYAFRHITEFILSGEYRTASLGILMFQPYGRIFVQQVTVIIGSFFLVFGAGTIFIIIFALIKILFEIFIDYDSLLKQSVSRQLNSSGQK